MASHVGSVFDTLLPLTGKMYLLITTKNKS